MYPRDNVLKHIKLEANFIRHTGPPPTRQDLTSAFLGLAEVLRNEFRFPSLQTVEVVPMIPRGSWKVFFSELTNVVPFMEEFEKIGEVLGCMDFRFKFVLNTKLLSDFAEDLMSSLGRRERHDAVRWVDAVGRSV